MKFISGNPFLKKVDGKIYFDSIPLEKILEDFKTPLMIFLENRLIENLSTFRNVFNSIFSNNKFEGISEGLNTVISENFCSNNKRGGICLSLGKN